LSMKLVWLLQTLQCTLVHDTNIHIWKQRQH